MSGNFDNLIKTYNEKIPNDLQNWKKIRALVNFSKAQEDVNIWEELEVIVRFYRKGFLWEEMEGLLDRLLVHYEVDYIRWAVKDAWVKEQIFHGQKCKKGISQLEFPFFDLDAVLDQARSEMPIYSKLERNKLIPQRLQA